MWMQRGTPSFSQSRLTLDLSGESHVFLVLSVFTVYVCMATVVT